VTEILNKKLLPIDQKSPTSHEGIVLQVDGMNLVFSPPMNDYDEVLSQCKPAAFLNKRRLIMASNQGGNKGNNQSGDTSNRGFASMDPEKQREIASEGGKAAHASGNAHEFNSERRQQPKPGRRQPRWWQPGWQPGQRHPRRLAGAARQGRLAEPQERQQALIELSIIVDRRPPHDAAGH
jgi:general stress protein YciG